MLENNNASLTCKISLMQSLSLWFFWKDYTIFILKSRSIEIFEQYSDKIFQFSNLFRIEKTIYIDLSDKYLPIYVLTWL